MKCGKGPAAQLGEFFGILHVCEEKNGMKRGKRMRVIFVRHGSTTALDEGRIQHPVFGRLNECGRRQAEVTRDALQGENFFRIVVSDSERARETADIILAGNHRGVPMRYAKGLCERDYGNLVGQSADEARRQHNESCDPISFRPSGGESIADVWRRAEAEARLFLREEFSEKSVLFIGHGTIFKCFLMVLDGFFPKSINDYLSWGGGNFENCSVSEVLVGWKNGFPKMSEKIRWNDTTHLFEIGEIS